MRALARRAFLRFAGTAAAAAPAIAARAAQASGGVLNGWAGTNFPGTDAGGVPVAEKDDPISAALKKQWCRQLDTRRREIEVKLAYRVNGYDADIDALRSVSFATKSRMQRARDVQARGPVLDLMDKLGWR